MSSLFSKPKINQVVQEAPPPPPTIDEARIAAESRDQANRRRGRASTVLTGSAGVAAPTNVGKTTLIGS